MNCKVSASFLTFIFILIFPILPLYFQILGMPVYNYLLLVMGFIGVYIFLKKGSMKIRLSGTDLVLLLWIFNRCLNNLISGSYTELMWFFIRTLIVCYVIVCVINSREKFEKSINIIVYVFGVLSIFGIIESVTHFNIFSILNTTGTALNYNDLRLGMIRIISYHSQTIVYCVSLMFAASLDLYAMSLDVNRKKINILRVIYALICINVLLTISRSAILAFAASQVLIMLKSGFKKFVVRAAALFVLGIAALPVIAVLFPGVVDQLKNMLYMLLALISPKYKDLVRSAFGDDNVTGIGNRMDLYSWVWDKMKGNVLLGYGYNADFSYGHRVTGDGYAWTAVKETIEVQYLAILYYYGITGLVAEIIAYISLLYYTIKDKFKPASWEGKLSYSYIIFIVLICYYLMFFAVNQSSEYKLFYVIIMLLFAYRKNKKFEYMV